MCCKTARRDADNQTPRSLSVVTTTTKHRSIAAGLARRHPFPMNNLNSLQEIARAIRNLNWLGGLAG
ncbi:hypothetical protein DP187_22230 [Enterobacter cloacae]|nr:hypothetical protein DP187_22230 [Enterobacter cloacae]